MPKRTNPKRTDSKGKGSAPATIGGGVPDRQVYVTVEGLARLRQELEHLQTVRRTEVAELIGKAKEIGDITDSAQYDAAKDEQGFLEARIRVLEDGLSRAVAIEEGGPGQGEVRLGSRVTLRDGRGSEEAWTVVGRTEADIAQGCISNESPVGRALLGRRPGDVVEVQTPSGAVTYSLVSIG